MRCIELGAEDYLPKPVNPVLLKARIGASLEKKRLRDQQKELVRRFATSEVAQDLQQSGFALGGKRVHGSVMFSDIRGFTALVESQPPEETIELLNTYYTLMFDAISGHGGVVNQMIGDGLMAIFGAPLPLADHARQRRARGARNDRADRAVQRSSGRPRARPPIRIGIGIASGEMVAGYTGTQQRATYTCIGDTVNLASRLEAHTKVAARAILIDGATHAALRERRRRIARIRRNPRQVATGRRVRGRGACAAGLTATPSGPSEKQVRTVAAVRGNAIAEIERPDRRIRAEVHRGRLQQTRGVSRHQR